MQGSGFRVQGSGFRVQDSGFRVQGSRFRVQGSGFRVYRRGALDDQAAARWVPRDRPQTRSEFPAASEKSRSMFYEEHGVERRERG